MRIGENSLNKFAPAGKRKTKKENKFNINNPIYRSIGSNKLYKYPDEYIEVYDIKNLNGTQPLKIRGEILLFWWGNPKNCKNNCENKHQILTRYGF